MKYSTASWAVLAALFVLSPPGEAQAPSREARINLRLAEQSLESVVDYVRDRSGVNIVVIDREGSDKPLSQAQVTMELTDVPWRDALDLVAEKVGAVVETRTGGVLAVTQPQRVTFEFPDADVREVIDTIAKASGANIVVGPEVQGTISVRFEDVPWRDALDVVSRTLGYTIVEENRGVLRVVDPLRLQDQLETRTYQLRYLRPKSMYRPIIKSEFLQNMAGQTQQQAGVGGAIDYMKTFSVLQALSKALSPAGELDYVDIQNMIIVRDTTEVHKAITSLLANLDVEPLQVFCDVKFVSTIDTSLLNLGVDYGEEGPTISGSGGAIPITFPFNTGSGGWDDYIIANPAGDTGPFVDPLLNAGTTVIPPTVFGALDFTQFQATLRMIQTDTEAEVIQAPKVVAIDGNETTIFVGETIRYAEAKSEQGQAGGLQLSIEEAAGSPVEVGFQLLIRPNVVPGSQQILMDIIPKETSLSGSSTDTLLSPAGFDIFTIGAAGLQGSIALPRTRASTIVTSMLLESGQTAVIGGLRTDSDTKIKTQIPYLGSIPILGELFKFRSKNRNQRSLMVFITPSIVYTRDDTQRILQQEFERRNVMLHDELNRLAGDAATRGTAQ